MDESKHEIHSQVDAITAGTASVVNLTAGEDSSHPPPLGKAWSPFSSLWMKINVPALPWRLEGGSLARAELTEPRPLLMCLENQQHSLPFHPTTSLSVHRLLPVLPRLCLTCPPLNHGRSVLQLSFPVPSFPNNVTIFWTRGFWGITGCISPPHLLSFPRRGPGRYGLHGRGLRRHHHILQPDRDVQGREAAGRADGG